MNAEVQRLRAFIDARKRRIKAAEKRYDIQTVVSELRELAAPLFNPERFSPTWKNLYLEFFYRDVTAFLLGFVAVHLEICLSDQDRDQAFDVFFDGEYVPPSRAIAALTATLSATKIGVDATDKELEQDIEASITQCIRLLEKVIQAGGVEDAVVAMLEQEQQPIVSSGQSVIGFQVLVSQLSSLPDLIYNRRQRDTPALFRPRRYFSMLCDDLFRACFRGNYGSMQWNVFRMFADKLSRIGQTQMFIQSWLRVVGITFSRKTSQSLFQSLPESSHEQILLQIANEKTPSSLSAGQTLCLPKYKLLALVPPTLCGNKHFQYVIAHKLLLRKPIEDLFFWRVLIDVLAQSNDDPFHSPLASVFEVVLDRWSQNDFATNTEYTVNSSVCFFLRYGLQTLTMHDGDAEFAQHEWITKLCKGVQDHMSNSLERVRILGMRVAESLSQVIASEKPLDFGLDDDDSLAIYGCPVMPEDLEESIGDLSLNGNLAGEEVQRSRPHTVDNHKTRRKKPKKGALKPFTLDPDELVLSDDEDVASDSGDSNSCSDDSDSDSDMSLEAYDLQDDEEDLTAKRPLYLKDLIAGLLSDDDREKTEAALTEAEGLLRRRPRDLNDKAQEVVRALLRLEDKYTTLHFVKLRSQALVAVCVLAPTQSLPYLCSQALEREQLLQSRIDVLQTMTSAAQELSERGGGYQRPRGPKTLLYEQVGSTSSDDAVNTAGLEERTMQKLKTRRWGYRRDPLAAPKRNAFEPNALAFFSPLLFGYVEYVQKHSAGSSNPRSEVEQTFLAHLLHALANFVECAGHSPQTVAMAKCLLEFSWRERANTSAEVRRQVLFSVSRVLLVVPPALLRQEVGDALAEVTPWLHYVQDHDPDAGCREAARLLSSFAGMPTLPLALR